MKQLLSGFGVLALAIGLVVVPGVAAKKGPKLVGGTVSVNVAPAATGYTASGNVASNSSCRKDRTLRFAYVNTETAAETPLAETTETRSNGDYSITLPPPSSAGTYNLKVTVDQAFRKVGSKKKGKKTKKGRPFSCLELTANSGTLTVTS